MHISEYNVEKAIAYFESYEGDLQVLVEGYLKSLPRLTSFIYSNNFSILGDEEKTVLEYVFLVMLKAIKNAGISLMDPEGELLAEMEDKNWEIMQEKSSNDFRKQLDRFFKESYEEELLALFEDSLESEEEEITPVGKEVIFIGLKTCMDCLLEPHN